MWDSPALSVKMTFQKTREIPITSLGESTIQEEIRTI